MLSIFFSKISSQNPDFLATNTSGTGQNCTKKKLHETTKLHEEKLAPRVSFARATFLHENKKKQKKKTKDKLIKKQNFARRVIVSRV